MSGLPSLKELLEAGVHFGHETKRWNPKMNRYIFGAREKIHVIDLEKTETALKAAVKFVNELGAKNGKIVFLATKKQASEIVKAEAQRVGAMFLSTRWVGGLFTNFDEVKRNITKLVELEEKSKDDKYTKREQLLMIRHLEKLDRYIGGVRNIEALPDAIFIVDSRKEDNAVKEARKMGIKIVAMVDTNGDPTVIDYPVPANDDAIRSISLIVKTIADAYQDGKDQASKKEDKVEAEEEKTEEVKLEASKPAEVEKETKTKKTATKKAVEKKVKTVKKAKKEAA